MGFEKIADKYVIDRVLLYISTIEVDSDMRKTGKAIP
jgi:hypothetical protein